MGLFGFAIFASGAPRFATLSCVPMRSRHSNTFATCIGITMLLTLFKGENSNYLVLTPTITAIMTLFLDPWTGSIGAAFAEKVIRLRPFRVGEHCAIIAAATASVPRCEEAPRTPRLNFADILVERSLERYAFVFRGVDASPLVADWFITLRALITAFGTKLVIAVFNALRCFHNATDTSLK